MKTPDVLSAMPVPAILGIIILCVVVGILSLALLGSAGVCQ